jgi:hypothetical protein
MAVVFCVIIYSNYYIQCFQSVIFYVYVKVNKEVYADTYSDFLKIDPNLTKSPGLKPNHDVLSRISRYGINS